MISKTFKYRLYPTKAQRTTLSRWIDLCRWVYNKTLEARKVSWEKEEKSLRLFDTNKLLTKWKKEIPVFKEVHSQVLQNVQYRVDKAYQNFFRRVKQGDKKAGYPRFRGKFRYDSLCFPQYPGGAVLESSVLKIRKIGDIRLNLHRQVKGRIKTTTIKRTSTDKWFVSFSVEIDKPKRLKKTKRVIGIDVGLESFLTTNTGEKVRNRRFFRTDEKALASVQRRFSKEKKGTPERRFRKKAVARIHERIRNRRSNFAHKISKRIVSHYGTIVFEDLSISKMVKNRCLSKSISDVAWSQLVQYTIYKAEEAGRIVVLVNPAYTSQNCSRCGHRERKKLSQRVHDCSVCGLVLDRDHNAALNILRLGLQSLGSSNP